MWGGVFFLVLNRFYMPHGITTDKDNNYWVTDVALHQVRVFSELTYFSPIFEQYKMLIYIVMLFISWLTDIQLKINWPWI